MKLTDYWAVCELGVYNSFNPCGSSIAYLSKDLYDILKFKKPNYCDIVAKNKRYPFFVFPYEFSMSDLRIGYIEHKISIPVEVYHSLEVESKYIISVRTDIFELNNLEQCFPCHLFGLF